MDYHIEISSIVQFVNDQLRQNTIVNYNAREIYTHIKKAVLDSETKPFLNPPHEGEYNSNYEKYARINAEWDGTYILDFFENDGAFYDLEKILYIFRENTNDETFRILFSLKIGELKSNGLPINEFLSFQVYDNFYGDEQSLYDFLQELLSIDGNFYLLPPNFNEEIEKWVDRKSDSKEEIVVEKPEIMKSPNTEKEEIEFKKYIESRKGFKIPGKLTDEQIRHFFSFLYHEKFDDRIPFLDEKTVNKIFANGLVIPKEIPVEKFRLNTNKKFPTKTIDHAIHLLYLKHSGKNKRDYVLFFACYLKEYEKALFSEKGMYNIASNMSGERSTKIKIPWDKYLPEEGV
jgi:hypothetical protein